MKEPIVSIKATESGFLATILLEIKDKDFDSLSDRIRAIRDIAMEKSNG